MSTTTTSEVKGGKAREEQKRGLGDNNSEGKEPMRAG